MGLDLPSRHHSNKTSEVAGQVRGVQARGGGAIEPKRILTGPWPAAEAGKEGSQADWYPLQTTQRRQTSRRSLWGQLGYLKVEIWTIPQSSHPSINGQLIWRIEGADKTVGVAEIDAYGVWAYCHGQPPYWDCSLPRGYFAAWLALSCNLDNVSRRALRSRNVFLDALSESLPGAPNHRSHVGIRHESRGRSDHLRKCRSPFLSPNFIPMTAAELAIASITTVVVAWAARVSPGLGVWGLAVVLSLATKEGPPDGGLLH